MKKTLSLSLSRCVAVATCLVLILNPASAVAADAAGASPQEAELIAVLRMDASPGDKAIACKRLAVYGGEASVPALAPLLTDERLSSWARIALEAIPSPAADEALRRALDQVQGRLLVGVINSLGVRRDRLAATALIARLQDNDPQVVAAAGEALGRIGGGSAAQALERSLARVSPEALAAVAEGCILCAEQFMAEGQSAEAVRLYDMVREANVPRPKVLEAIRGAILARGPGGLPMLLEQLRSPDKDVFDVALWTARELPGREVTEALVKELGSSTPRRQGLILLAVGDRNDAVVLPAVTELARSGSPELRMVAVGILEQKGALASLPVILEAATEEHEELAQTARVSLTRLGGADVDADLVSRLQESQGRACQVLLELIGLRGIERAVPRVMPYVSNPDAGIRHAAVETVGTLGTREQVSALVAHLQQAPGPRDRADLQKALLGIAGREGEGCVPVLMPLTRDGDQRVRVAALHMLAAAGGAEALAAVRAALQDSEEAVQDEAVRTLASWPNTWPEDARVAEPLLALAKSGAKPSHRVQGVRGYLQFVREDGQLGPADKLARITTILPYVERPDEKRLVISVLGAVPTSEALELLVTFTGDGETAEEACQSIVKIATGPGLGGGAADARQKALRTVLERSQNEATRLKAKELL